MAPVDSFVVAQSENLNLAKFELRFNSLFTAGRALTFPCSCTGEVDMDSLSERALNNYLGARARMGIDYASPQVVLAGLVSLH